MCHNLPTEQQRSDHHTDWDQSTVNCVITDHEHVILPEPVAQTIMPAELRNQLRVLNVNQNSMSPLNFASQRLENLNKCSVENHSKMRE